MIKELKIQNFQSHKNSNLSFDKGVNMIIGSSDSGKTAIIRALQWVLWNRPGGDAFRSNWGGKTSVELTTDENNIITRIKDKTDNIYKLNEQIYKAFGTDIPDDIKKVLNINPINCQQQLDSPFLLTETPGEVAKYFNRIAHLEQIDKSLQNIEKWLRNIKRNLESNKERLKELNVELQSFDYLQKFEIDVEALEERKKQYTTKENDLRNLKELEIEFQNIISQIQKESKILPLEKDVNNILILFEKKEKIKIERIELIKLIEKIRKLKQTYKENKRIIKSESIINFILNLYNNKKEKKEKIFELEDFLYRYEQIQKNKKIYIEKYENLKEKFNKNFPDICPLCGQAKPKQI